MSATFTGYSMRNIYPNFGVEDQGEATIPEVAEQEAYAQVDAASVTTGVSKKTSLNIWLLLGAIVVIILLFGKG